MVKDGSELTLSRFTQVLNVGRRYWSEPESRMKKLGTNSLNPVTNEKGNENKKLKLFER